MRSKLLLHFRILHYSPSISPHFLLFHLPLAILNPHTAMPPLIGGLETSRTKDLLLLTSDPLESMEIVGEVRVSLSFGLQKTADEQRMG